MCSHRSKVGVVVLNWNGGQDTIACLQSLRQLNYAHSEIYVVDNASTDDSVEVLRRWDPNILLLESDRNLGWAGGNNVGIRAALAAGAEQVWLLNNDATVSASALSHLMMASAMIPNVAAVGSLIVSAGNSEWAEFAGCVQDPRTRHPRQIMDHRSNLVPPWVQEVVAVKGCSMLMTKKGIERIGLLDEDYFLNYEETDWCLRARRAGFVNLIAKQSVVFHKGAVSFKGTDSPMYQYFITRNRLLFAKRNLDRKGCRFAWRAVQWEIRQCLFLKKGKLRERVFLIIAIFLGVFSHMTRRYGDCPKIIRSLNRRRQFGA